MTTTTELTPYHQRPRRWATHGTGATTLAQRYLRERHYHRRDCPHFGWNAQSTLTFLRNPDVDAWGHDTEPDPIDDTPYGYTVDIEPDADGELPDWYPWVPDGDHDWVVDRDMTVRPRGHEPTHGDVESSARWWPGHEPTHHVRWDHQPVPGASRGVDADHRRAIIESRFEHASAAARGELHVLLSVRIWRQVGDDWQDTGHESYMFTDTVLTPSLGLSFTVDAGCVSEALGEALGDARDADARRANAILAPWITQPTD